MTEETFFKSMGNQFLFEVYDAEVMSKNIVGYINKNFKNLTCTDLQNLTLEDLMFDPSTNNMTIIFGAERRGKHSKIILEIGRTGTNLLE